MKRSIVRKAAALAILSTTIGMAFAQTTPAQREAAAARAGTAQLTTPSADQANHNAQLRCQSLPAGYKQACLDRVAGQGSRSGSVEGGGMIFSSETTATLEPMPATRMDRSAESTDMPRATPPKHNKKPLRNQTQ